MCRLALLASLVFACSGGTPRAAEVRPSPPATSRISTGPSEQAPHVAAPDIVMCVGRLSELTLSGAPLEPPFSPCRKEYAATLGAVSGRTILTAIAASAEDIVSIDGHSISGGEFPIEMDQIGERRIEIRVRSPNGEEAIYSIQLTRRATLVEHAILRRRDAHENDFFGYAIASHGDTMAIGCPLLDDPAGPYEDSGALYVFSRYGPSWVERASVTASKPGSQYKFGTAVSVWGDRIAVGAPGEGPPAPPYKSNGEGAVYVFMRDGPGWREEARITATPKHASDGFGSSVALWNDTLVVGAPSDGLEPGPGGLFVFERKDGGWVQTDHMPGSTPYAFFGQSVALWEDTLAVSAPRKNDPRAPGAGAVYVYERSESKWRQRVVLKPSKPGDRPNKYMNRDVPFHMYFGTSIALRGDTLAVGDSRSGTTAPPSGAVYLYARRRSTWVQVDVLHSPPPGTQGFGLSVSIAENGLAVGSISGQAVLIPRDGAGRWNAGAPYQVRGEFSDEFSWGLALSDRELVVAASGEDGPATAKTKPTPNAGAVHVLR